MVTCFQGFEKRYDDGFTLNIPSLEIKSGQRVGIVGNNGAGKTTLLLSMLGLLRFQKGDVEINGRSVRSFDVGWRSQSAAYLGESSLISFLTPWEFWQFVGDAYGVSREEQRLRLYAFADFVELPPHAQRKKKLIRDFSQGQRKKIGLVAAIMVRPRRLVLDEPFTHLDPRSRARFEELILSQHASHETTTVISSHDLEHVVGVSDRVLLIEKGRIRFDGSVDSNTLHAIRTHLTGRPIAPAPR